MAKARYTFILVLLFYFCTGCSNKVVSITQPTVIQTATPTSSFPEIYHKYIGVREATGNNDGFEVEMFLKSVGLEKGNSWCAAFVHFCLNEAGIPNTITGWSPTAHNPNNVVWFNRKLLKPAQQGDVFTLYSGSLGRIHHTGFYDGTVNTSIYQTVEGNTNIDGSSNGNGVYARKRSFNSTYSITRWKKD